MSRPISSELETVLLAVTGQSPAILVETVWALAQERPSIVPTRVICITTTTGKSTIINDLLSPAPKESIWSQLRTALKKKGLPVEKALQFGTTSDDIRVVTARDSKTGETVELDDIRTREDNEAAADFILRQLRGFTETPSTQIIANLAGGRKTMGALMYACMSLVGRETDRLTHVLVPPEYEGALTPKFYFPDQVECRLKSKNGAILDARKARITLADVPFVSLRNLFNRQQLARPQSFAELVARSRSDVSSRMVKLIIFQSKTKFVVNDQPVETSAAEHILLLKLGHMCREKASPISSYKYAADAVEAYARDLSATLDVGNFSDWRAKLFNRGTNGQWSANVDDRFVARNLSSLRKKLEKMPEAARVLAHYFPTKGRFFLDLPPESVDICD